MEDRNQIHKKKKGADDRLSQWISEKSGRRWWGGRRGVVLMKNLRQSPGVQDSVDVKCVSSIMAVPRSDLKSFLDEQLEWQL